MRAGGTARASSRLRTASSVRSGDVAGSKPRRLRYSCPSGKRPRTWWAQWVASAVLPTPAVPEMATIGTAVTRSPGWCSVRSSSASSAPRPVKPRTSIGSCAGTKPVGWAAAGSGTARAGSLRRICSYRRRRSGPGSRPSSSTRWRRAVWYAESASAGRPRRYSAIIRSPTSPSRVGCCSTASARSAMTSPGRSAASAASARPSIAASRSSSSRAPIRSRSASLAASASSGPRHSASASVNRSTRRTGSEVLRASATRAVKRWASTRSGSMSARYPSPPVSSATPCGASRARRRAT